MNVQVHPQALDATSGEFFGRVDRRRSNYVSDALNIRTRWRCGSCGVSGPKQRTAGDIGQPRGSPACRVRQSARHRRDMRERSPPTAHCSCSHRSQIHAAVATPQCPDDEPRSRPRSNGRPTSQFAMPTDQHTALELQPTQRFPSRHHIMKHTSASAAGVQRGMLARRWRTPLLHRASTASASARARHHPPHLSAPITGGGQSSAPSR